MSPDTTAGLPTTGAARQFLQSAESGRPAAHRARPDGVSRVLYVAAWSYPSVGPREVLVLKYGRWTYLTAITNSLSNPFPVWVDKSANLYVGNANAGVDEYNFEGSLIYDYSASGLYEPQGIATDRFGNVYVASYAGAVYEFQQQTNNYISCTPSVGYLTGVTVDKRGDVFVSTGNSGEIVEYKRGLWNSRCTGTVLPVALDDAIAIAIDPQGDLVVADYYAPAVDIIAPPYTSITGTLGSGWTHPYNVTIDRAGTQAYVADEAGPIQILTYPGGNHVATLSTVNGYNQLWSAVDSENYVP